LKNVVEEKKRYEGLRKLHTALVFDAEEHMASLPTDRDNLGQLEYLAAQPWFIEAKALGEGAAFGELALINDEPRAATVKCRADCSFATLDKAEYDKFVQKLRHKKTSARTDFFSKLPYLKHWTSTQIKRLVDEDVELGAYKRNQFVYRQGDPSKFIYVVLHGNFEVIRRKRVRTKVQPVGIDPRRMIGPNIDDITKQRQLKTGKTSILASDIPIAVLTDGQIFGQEDVINEREHTTSVKCLTNDGSLYVLPAFSFFQKLSRDEKTWNMIVGLSLNKDKSTKRQIKEATFVKGQERKGLIATSVKSP
jgi:CRP-like cAMP-binding protein